MKIITEIRVGHGEVESTLEARLRSVFPRQDAPLGFTGIAPHDDKRIQEVLSLLNDSGLKPWDFTQGRSRVRGSEYALCYSREYDSSDLKACEYLEILPPGKGFHREAKWRTKAGQMILPKYKMPRGFDIMLTHLRIAYFVTDRAKGILENAGLQHVGFLPACYGPSHLEGELDEGDTEDLIAARYGRLYWEIDSDLILPRLSPSLRLTDVDGTPWDGEDYSNGLHPREGLFLHPELRYRRSDLDKIGPFDLGRTYEPFGNYRAYDPQKRRLIASKRFYEVCLANKLKTGWVPVRIDEE